MDSGRPYMVHESAIVDEPCAIGSGTKIWHFCHICSGAEIGENCNFGQNCFVAGGVKIGHNVKVQNNVSIYTGTIIEDDVFLGPSCVLTNVTNPRSQVVRRGIYETTRLQRGATVGANATIVCGITLGRYSFVAAGAVLARDIPDYALVMGVPGRQTGWMSRHGQRLSHPSAEGIYVCAESGFRYQLTTDESTGVEHLHCLDLPEDEPLPENLRTGQKTYDEFRAQNRGG